jgi:poly(A) polymerase
VNQRFQPDNRPNDPPINNAAAAVVTPEIASDRILGDPASRLALDTISELSRAGYVAYLAGGCVRDALLGKLPKDYDVATDATPEQIRQLIGYRRTLAIGAAFGVITVLGRKSDGLAPVEVATFRSDGKYSDGRHPDSVQYSTPQFDAQRRDFTINGLFYDPADRRVIDFVDGVDDLKRGAIRAIRDPQERFEEDKLRLLRAVRFATTLGFQLETQTRDAIVRLADRIVVCSGERIGAEMTRILADPQAAAGLRMLRDTRLLTALMPDVDAALSAAPQRLETVCRWFEACTSHDFRPRLAMLLVAAGGSPRLLASVVSAWHLANDHRDAVKTAIDDYEQLLCAQDHAWSKLQPLLVKRWSQTSVAVARAIEAADGDYGAAIERIDRALALPPQLLDPAPLVTGNDLIQMGKRPGPEFKRILADVRNAQLDGELETPEAARRWIDGHG